MKNMKRFSLITALAGILLNAASGTLHAQWQSSGNSQSFTQKIDMSNAGNKDGTYYLLLCKLLPNATSQMTGAITFESDTLEICEIEVNVLSDPLSGDSKYAINNPCDVVRSRLVTVQ